MQTVLIIALSNAAVASALALLAAASRPLGRPALTHALWLLVLLKLITPPVFRVPVWLVDSRPRPAPPLPRTLDSEPVRPRTHPWPRRDTTADVFVVERPSAHRADIPDPRAEITEGRADKPQSLAATPLPAPTVAAGTPPQGPSPAMRLSWPLAAVLAWAVGSLGCIAVILRRLALFRRLLRHAAPAPFDVQAQSDLLARRLGMQRSPPVMILPGPVCPMLVALGPARLLIPSGLWSHLDDDQRQSLLLHELAHLRRRDHWVRLLETLVTAAYWWLPTAWAARRALREAEEQCCDAWVLWAMPGPGGARAYATALLEALDFTSRSKLNVHGRPLGLPALASGLGEFHQLKRRLIMIKQANAPRRLSWGGALLVAGLMIGLPLSPSAAQQADEPAAAPLPVVVESQPPAAEPVPDAPEIPAVTPAPVAGIKGDAPYVAGAAAPPRPGRTPAPGSASNARSSDFAAKGPISEDAREELEEARREVAEAEKELKKAVDKLAKLEQKLTAKGPTTWGRATTPKAAEPRGRIAGPAQDNLPAGKLGQWERSDLAGPRDMDREMRLQVLERQLASLLEEVRALRHESGSLKRTPPGGMPMPDPAPKPGSSRAR